MRRTNDRWMVLGVTSTSFLNIFWGKTSFRTFLKVVRHTSECDDWSTPSEPPSIVEAATSCPCKVPRDLRPGYINPPPQADRLSEIQMIPTVTSTLLHMRVVHTRREFCLGLTTTFIVGVYVGSPPYPCSLSPSYPRHARLLGRLP